ncbi:hypothetical protein [Bacteroides sp.]|uniref:hypothetical protein n=1 Tax=Bacteroides sp. TaxID=29523 RepID=UPI002631F204|nr:hypothetical protein [Bacteroides sp.]MDD3037379.1 hypothetical protein [Bacteroides sp.]
MKNRLIILLLSTLIWEACTSESITDDKFQTNNASINLSVSTLAVNDPASINQDQSFGSLAIYLYNNDASFTLERSVLLPSFTPTSTRDIPLQTQIGTKILYLIANYAGKTFKLSDGSVITLSTTTSKQQLDNIITESGSGFSPASLLMVGKQSISIASSDNGRIVNVPLRRLQARVDVHVFKGTNFGANVVTLESITLHNQVLNSEVKFDYTVNSAQMLTSPMFNNQLITNTSALSSYVNGTVLQPTNAKANFYSFQNLVTVLSPLQATAPYLEIKLNSNGVSHTYTGYLTDNNQTANKYSLLQNNVYQVLAVLDIDSKIVLNVTVLPWNQTNIEYERPITANDFTFGPWGTSWGGINGKTMNTNVGGIEDAVFQFQLKAPVGAAWTATLNNGLDFGFTSSTAGTTTPTVSSGFTQIGVPYLIAVRALKRWTGVSRDTELYITVEGNEIPINPIVGTQRVYEGTDTRIKIKQVASYN